MANLQESFIGNAKLGRGCGNIVTNTVFGCLALNTTSANNNCNVAIGEKTSCTNCVGSRVSIGYNAGIDAYESVISIGAGLTQFNVGKSIQIGQGTCNRYENRIIIGALAGGYLYNNPNLQALIGYKAGRNMCNNSNGVNIIIGASAGYCFTSGAGNILIGNSAGFYVTTGENNTAIGQFAGSNITTTYCTIAIGKNSSPSNSACHTSLGNASSTDGWIYPAQWDVPSDCRDKTDIENLPNNLGLNFIRKLRPVTFKWDRRQEYVNKCDFEFGQKDGTLTHSQKKYGFIAQEIKTAIEELNVTFEGLGYDSEKDIYQLQQYSLVPSIIKAIQETDDRLTLLEQQLSN